VFVSMDIIHYSNKMSSYSVVTVYYYSVLMFGR
jgi:hypothetical protein